MDKAFADAAELAELLRGLGHLAALDIAVSVVVAK